ncbi:MAG: hypothetical protein CMJ65_09840 [Planctomycetaceae bacterium]|nr:hypothetical protein [Planctomycetaceae bacterium]
MADQFVAKLVAGDVKTASGMVSSSARAPVLKNLRAGKMDKNYWKQALQGAQRQGVARAIRRDRIVTLINSQGQTIRITLRKGRSYEVYSLAVSKLKSKTKTKAKTRTKARTKTSSSRRRRQ